MALVLFFHLLAVLTLASGKPIFIPRQGQEAAQDVAQPSFDVTLESLGNTSVKAQVTNLGTEGLRLVQRGGILDHVPTKKVTVKGGDSDPVFTGVRVEYILSHLTRDGFVQVAPNQTVASIFDIADFYELSPNQEYTAVANGALEYTTLADEKKFLTFNYHSNNISFTAPADITSRLAARSTLQCSDDYNQVVQDAIARAAKMATAAAEDARKGSALFQKFFKSTSQADIDEVAGRLEAIAKEATTTGQLTYYCEPTEEDYCSANVAAMTYPTLNRVVNCPGYYTSTKVSNYCGYLDQAAITLHEYAHASALYDPGTEDIAYGYDAVLSLDTQDSKNNADNFAYYASAVFLQCAVDDSITVGTALDVDIGQGTGDDSNTNTNTPTTDDTTQTPTATQEPTNNPPATPTSTGTSDTGTGTGTGTGWDWPWGGNWDQNGGGSGDNGNSNTPTGPTTETETGTGTSFGGWGWGWGKDSGSDSGSTTVVTATSTSAPVTTSDGQEIWNMQDLVNWLMSKYANGQGQTQTQMETQTENSSSNSGTVAVETDQSTNSQTGQTEDCDQ